MTPGEQLMTETDPSSLWRASPRQAAHDAAVQQMYWRVGHHDGWSRKKTAGEKEGWFNRPGRNRWNLLPLPSTILKTP